MLMNDVELREALANGDIILEGIEEHQVGNVTLDVKLGNKFLAPLPGQLIDVTDEHAEVQYEEHDGPYVLMPGEFILAVVKEKITLCDSVVATIYGRSNTSRLGLVISEGPIIDAGFSGYITLEIYNQSPYSIKLSENYRVAHYAFHKINPVQVPYMEKANAKYTDQTEVKPYPWRVDKEWKTQGGM